jgi:hypothetical protein
MTINDVKAMFISQIQGGCFGIWEIVKVLKEDMGVRDPREVKKLALEVVRDLLESGARSGASPYVTQGEFVAWPEGALEATLDRIACEWDALGREHDITDSPWFDR